MKSSMRNWISITIAIFLLISSESRSADTKKTNNTRDPLRGMQEKYKNTRTLSAEFTQKQKSLALGETKESQGRIYIRRPNMFRWETHQPTGSIMVGNGQKVWIYTAPFREGEKGQVAVRRAADVQSQLAIDLLAGGKDVKKHFKIKELEPFRFELLPLKGSGDVERIELYLEKKTNLVYKLALFTTTGNQTELILTHVDLNPKLSDQMFNFKIPANTEEIR